MKSKLFALVPILFLLTFSVAFGAEESDGCYYGPVCGSALNGFDCWDGCECEGACAGKYDYEDNNFCEFYERVYYDKGDKCTRYSNLLDRCITWSEASCDKVAVDRTDCDCDEDCFESECDTTGDAYCSNPGEGYCEYVDVDESPGDAGCYSELKDIGEKCYETDACCISGTCEEDSKAVGNYICCPLLENSDLQLNEDQTKCDPTGDSGYIGDPVCVSGGTWECAAEGYHPSGIFRINFSVSDISEEHPNVRWTNLSWINSGPETTEIGFQYGLGDCDTYQEAGSSPVVIDNEGTYSKVCLIAELSTSNHEDDTPLLEHVVLTSKTRLSTTTQEDLEYMCSEKIDRQETVEVTLQNGKPGSSESIVYYTCDNNCPEESVFAAKEILNSADYKENNMNDNRVLTQENACIGVFTPSSETE